MKECSVGLWPGCALSWRYRQIVKLPRLPNEGREAMEARLYNFIVMQILIFMQTFGAEADAPFRSACDWPYRSRQYLLIVTTAIPFLTQMQPHWWPPKWLLFPSNMSQCLFHFLWNTHHSVRPYFFNLSYLYFIFVFARMCLQTFIGHTKVTIGHWCAASLLGKLILARKSEKVCPQFRLSTDLPVFTCWQCLWRRASKQNENSSSQQSRHLSSSTLVKK